MATIRIQTAQNVTLEYEVASVGDRIVAVLLDYVVLVAWGGAWALLFAFAASTNGSSGTNKPMDFNDPTTIIAIILLLLVFLPFVFYDLICEVFFNGQSIGKKARNIRVMRLDGTKPSLGDYLLRWLLRIVDMQFSGLVAIIAISANGRGQRLGDMAAGTTVVSVKPRPAAMLVPSLESLVGYQVVFPQAALLADHDVALVRQLMQQASARGNFELLNEVANKVKALTGIRTELQDAPFLHTILRDHAFLAAGA